MIIPTSTGSVEPEAMRKLFDRLLNNVNFTIEVLAGMCVSDMAIGEKVRYIETRFGLIQADCDLLSHSVGFIGMNEANEIQVDLVGALNGMRSAMLALAQPQNAAAHADNTLFVSLTSCYRIAIERLRLIDSGLQLSSRSLRTYEKRLPYFNRLLGYLINYQRGDESDT